jgi:hypothetical protein
MRFAIATSLSLCACAGPLSGPLAFPPNIQVSGGMVDAGGFVTDLIVIMADFDESGTSCTQQLSMTLSGKTLVIDMRNSDGSIVVPGSYAVGATAGSVATLSMQVTYPDGGIEPVARAVSGNVTLTNVRSLTAGSFSVSMVLADGGSGGVLNGSFNPQFCGG